MKKDSCSLYSKGKECILPLICLMTHFFFFFFSSPSISRCRLCVHMVKIPQWPTKKIDFQNENKWKMIFMYETTYTSLQFIVTYLLFSYSLSKEKILFLNFVMLRTKTQNNICLTKISTQFIFFYKKFHKILER